VTGDDSAAAEGDTMRGPPDPQTMLLAEGEAALFLAEGILMALLDSGVLSGERVHEIMNTLIDTKRQMVEERQQPLVSQAAVGILASIANSLAAIK
jgi:hypothetical protein